MRRPMTTILYFALLMGLFVACGPAIKRPEAPETHVMPALIIKQFKEECALMAHESIAKVPGLVMGRDGWCYQLSELQFGAADPFFGDGARKVFPKAGPEDADPLGAILDFKKDLEERGIELLFIPIPVRPVIYPEGVIPLGEFENAEPLPHVKPMQDEFLRRVHEAGVETIDLSAYFLANRPNERGALYCRSDTHWTPKGALLAAQVVGAYLKTSRWYEDSFSREPEGVPAFTARWLAKEHFGHCYRKLRDSGGIQGLPKDKVSFRKIGGEDMDGEKGETLRHRDAPVVVLGDSNLIIWHDIQSAFSQELAFELGFHVDTLQTAGGGINQSRLDFIREASKDPAYLDGKKAVLWIFTARGETQAKPYWIKTPLEAPKDGEN